MERPINGVGWIVVHLYKPEVLDNKVYSTYGEAEKASGKENNTYIAEVCTPHNYWCGKDVE